MIIISKRLLWLILIIYISTLSAKNKSIKTFHVFNSFGTQTRELKNSITLKYNKHGFLTDSTIFLHSIPLSEKYIYVAGPNERLKLERKYGKEKVLDYQFENDSLGKRISTTLYGQGDSIYWKEFIKYDDRGVLIKKIRYNPLEAVNPKMIPNKKEYGKLIWGEIYDYDSSGMVLERKDIYNNYILEITTFDIDSLKNPKKRKEYFDPSVIFRTIYFHNEDKKLIQEISVGRNGESIGSKSYEYDVLGRRIKITYYNNEGIIDEIIKYIYDDNNFKTYEYYFDSSLELFSLKEILLNNQGKPYIEALLDSEERILEKNVYYYYNNGQIDRIKQYDMARQKEYDNIEIPFKVSIYEY